MVWWICIFKLGHLCVFASRFYFLELHVTFDYWRSIFLIFRSCTPVGIHVWIDILFIISAWILRVQYLFNQKSLILLYIVLPTFGILIWHIFTLWRYVVRLLTGEDQAIILLLRFRLDKTHGAIILISLISATSGNGRLLVNRICVRLIYGSSGICVWSIGALDILYLMELKSYLIILPTILFLVIKNLRAWVHAIRIWLIRVDIIISNFEKPEILGRSLYTPGKLMFSVQENLLMILIQLLIYSGLNLLEFTTTFFFFTLFVEDTLESLFLFFLLVGFTCQLLILLLQTCKLILDQPIFILKLFILVSIIINSDFKFLGSLFYQQNIIVFRVPEQNL